MLQQGFAPLPERQQLTAILLAVGILILVLELVRRRRLREEFSWVWVAVSITLLTLALTETPLVTLTAWIGAASRVSTLFFGALVFLLLLALQFSIRLSKLTHRHKSLSQRTALLESELRRLRRTVGREATDSDDRPSGGHEEEPIFPQRPDRRSGASA